ncbi:MAG: helix-turn-helix domain-containing protein [Desulfobacterales bacterium]|jgi:sugar-specific transcriptional regulator TrmB
MDITSLLQDFAFSKYESSCYLALLTQHPCNGSQLSKLSGIARSRIYDVLRGLTRKGIVFEIEKGLFVPLPFDELKKRLQSQFAANLRLLEKQVKQRHPDTDYDYLLTVRGRREAIRKAVDIIDGAREEIYLRLFPNTWQRLKNAICKARDRGVGLRLVGMGAIPAICEIQVTHPETAALREKLGGESVDIIVDQSEALVGIFETGQEAASPIIWTRNRWFVIASRDSLRHDFYHYFLDKIYDRGETLSPQDQAIYEFIKQDD